MPDDMLDQILNSTKRELRLMLQGDENTEVKLSKHCGKKLHHVQSQDQQYLLRAVIFVVRRAVNQATDSAHDHWRLIQLAYWAVSENLADSPEQVPGQRTRRRAPNTAMTPDSRPLQQQNCWLDEAPVAFWSDKPNEKWQEERYAIQVCLELPSQVRRVRSSMKCQKDASHHRSGCASVLRNKLK